MTIVVGDVAGLIGSWFFADRGRTGTLLGEGHEEVTEVSPEPTRARPSRLGLGLGEEVIERVELGRREWLEVRHPVLLP